MTRLEPPLLHITTLTTEFRRGHLAVSARGGDAGVAALDARRWSAEVYQGDVDALAGSDVDRPRRGRRPAAGLRRHDARQQALRAAGRRRRRRVATHAADRRHHCATTADR